MYGCYEQIIPFLYNLRAYNANANSFLLFFIATKNNLKTL